MWLESGSPIRKLVPMRGNMRAWTRAATEKMVRTHTKRTPQRSYEVDGLIKRDKVKEDGNSIYRISGHRIIQLEGRGTRIF